jgi:hypothetical protein
MREFNPALGHHLDQISKAEFEPKVPAHTKNDDFPVEMAAIEEFFRAGPANSDSEISGFSA